MSTFIFLLLFSLPAFASNIQKNEKHEWFKGEFVAKVKDSKTLSDRKVLGIFSSEYLLEPSSIVRLQSDDQEFQSLSVELQLKLLRDTGLFEYVEPNYVLRLIAPVKLKTDRKSNQTVPHSEILSNTQWGLDRIEAQRAWNYSKGSSGVVVAVVDTGIDPNHYDLKDNMWWGKSAGKWVYGYNAIHSSASAYDDNGHGTHVAGVIGANATNGSGIQGINWNVKLMAIKFMGKEGYGSLADAIKGIQWAVSRGAHILNNSWGGGSYSEAMNETLNWVQSRGVFFVAAAGNSAKDNDREPAYPASYPHAAVISVAALAENDRLAYFSNYGDRTVDIAAPGDRILSTTPGHKFETMSGTSMAAPHVAGALALLKAKYPSDSMSRISSRLLSRAKTNPWIHRKVINGASLNVYESMGGEAHDPGNGGSRPPITWDPTHRTDIASPSPYPSNYTGRWTLEHPGATYMSIYFRKFSVERNYDFVKIYDGQGRLVDVISGDHHEGIWSAVIRGDKAVIELTTDKMINKRGFWATHYVTSHQ